MPKFYFIIAIKIIIAIFALWLVGLWNFVALVDGYKPTTTKTDAIIVLTGSNNRIKEGITLKKEGMGDRLFISGVSPDVTAKEFAESFNYKGEVELGKSANNTIENAIEVSDWVQKYQINSIRLVTSDYHLPRSINEIKAMNDNLVIIPHPVKKNILTNQWFKSEYSTNLLIKEYNKFLLSYIKIFTQKL